MTIIIPSVLQKSSQSKSMPPNAFAIASITIQGIFNIEKVTILTKNPVMLSYRKGRNDKYDKYDFSIGSSILNIPPQQLKVLLAKLSILRSRAHEFGLKSTMNLPKRNRYDN